MEHSQYEVTAKLINNTRSYYNLTRQQLTYGLCERSLLTKIVKSDKNRHLDKLLVDALLQRMGRSTRDFEYLLIPEEYILFERRKKLRKQLEAMIAEKDDESRRESFQSAGKQIRTELKEYRTLIPNDRLHEQFALYIESCLFSIEEQNILLQYQTVREALIQTIPGIEMTGWDKFCYSTLELTLAIQMSYLNCLLGREEGWRQMEELYMLLERDYYADGEQIAVFAPLIYRLAKHYKETGNYELAYRISADGAKQLLEKNKFYYVKELLQIREEAVIAKHFGTADLEKQWEKTLIYPAVQLLQELFVEFYPAWNADAHYPVYYEYGNLSLGAEIKGRRNLLGFTQEEMVQYCDDEQKGEMCSVMTLSRLENEQTATQWRHIKRMLEKLNMPPALCCYNVVVENYEQMMELHDIAVMTEQKEEKEAKRRLEKIKLEKPYIDCPASRQGLWFLEYCVNCKLEDTDLEDRLQQLVTALEWTIPKGKTGEVGQCHMFASEYSLLRSISLTLSRLGKREEAVKVLYKLLRSYCGPAMEGENGAFELEGKLYKVKEEFAHKAAGLLHTLESVMANSGHFKEANRYLKQSMELCIRHNIAGLIPFLLYDKAWNMEQEQGSRLDWDKYRQYVRTAYAVDQMRHEVIHLEGIKRHCQKYYPNKNILNGLDVKAL